MWTGLLQIRVCITPGLHPKMLQTSAKLHLELGEKSSLHFLLDHIKTVSEQLEDIKNK